MVKHFCDCCGRELVRNYVSDRLSGSTRVGQGIVYFTVQAGVNSAINAGDICASCLLAALRMAAEEEM